MPRFVFGVDVGGTGIQCGLFEVSARGILENNDVWRGNLTTNRGVEPHVAQVASLIKMARSAAIERDGCLAGVGVASPGRFSDGIILHGTSPNMGITVNEFDGVCLQERYVSACEQVEVHNIPIFVHNDADAMAMGLLVQLEQSPENFRDQNYNSVDTTQDVIIGYLGLGTGLGNSFMQNSSFINDGHLSKIIISIDPEDIAAFFRVYEERGSEMQHFDSTMAEANLESLVCTPTLKVLAELETNELLDMNILNHQQAITLVGKYLAKGMIAVRDGTIRDITPKNQWNPGEIEEARSTSLYLLGGGVMGDNNVANRLAQEIDTTLIEALGITHGIRVVPMGCDNPAVYAAANLLPRRYRLPE